MLYHPDAGYFGRSRTSGVGRLRRRRTTRLRARLSSSPRGVRAPRVRPPRPRRANVLRHPRAPRRRLPSSKPSSRPRPSLRDRSPTPARRVLHLRDLNRRLDWNRRNPRRMRDVRELGRHARRSRQGDPRRARGSARRATPPPGNLPARRRRSRRGRFPPERSERHRTHRVSQTFVGTLREDGGDDVLPFAVTTALSNPPTPYAGSVEATWRGARRAWTP